MGKAKINPPVKLVIALIFKDETVLNTALGLLHRKFGDFDFQSENILFAYTDYYQKEFGTNLKRKFISFKKLVRPENLHRIKTLTNSLENKLSSNGLRQINIDPGYLDLAKFVLASTKDFCHRIYLDQGIYAEITLFYQDKAFLPWKYTYPDYRSNEYIAILNQVREIYYQQIKDKS